MDCIAGNLSVLHLFIPSLIFLIENLDRSIHCRVCVRDFWLAAPAERDAGQFPLSEMEAMKLLLVPSTVNVFDFACLIAGRAIDTPSLPS